ncbi:hypothetical protein [Rhizobium sp. BK377]|uniref:hypothetical protein n=1 Tax=Rhizobium sp. BK377 TaxID=2587058 RepID=UPI001609BB52|nr:hypothetical protein [Rhizobium sp. BK377]MBB3461936.1 hypothetical protein [Rhizobium sp. BK377]
MPEETPNAPFRAAKTGGPEALPTRRTLASGRTVRPPDTLNRALEIRENLERYRTPPRAIPAPAITVCTFLETWPALFFFAGFHMPRYAVPFSGIKAKKIPIVQPKLTSEAEKIH